MKNISLSFFFVWFFSLVSILFLVGCNQDEVETSEEQFKPVLIRMTSSVPIHQTSGLESQNVMIFSTNFGSSTLSNEVPNEIGDNILEFSSTAVSNRNLNIHAAYIDYEMNLTNNQLDVSIGCSEINVKIFFDNVLVFDEFRELGGVTEYPCPDGFEWSFNYTLQ
jgi:hypothetical protein